MSRQRNVVERFFCRLEDLRRIHTRYEKRADIFLSALLVVAAHHLVGQLGPDPRSSPRQPGHPGWRGPLNGDDPRTVTGRITSDGRTLSGEEKLMSALARSKNAATFEVVRTQIDFQSGWCVGNLGWSPPEIERALCDFAGPAYVYPRHRYAPWEELAGALVEIAPPGLERCFRATGGSEAVEIALQPAMLHTGRARVVTIEGCYHGNTLGPRSIGDGETRRLFPRLGLPTPRTIRPPLDEARLSQVETALKRRDVAAMILEPVICNLGALVPEPAFLRGVHAL